MIPSEVLFVPSIPDLEEICNCKSAFVVNTSLIRNTLNNPSSVHVPWLPEYPYTKF